MIKESKLISYWYTMADGFVSTPQVVVNVWSLARAHVRTVQQRSIAEGGI